MSREITPETFSLASYAARSEAGGELSLMLDDPMKSARLIINGAGDLTVRGAVNRIPTLYYEPLRSAFTAPLGQLSALARELLAKADAALAPLDLHGNVLIISQRELVLGLFSSPPLSAMAAVFAGGHQFKLGKDHDGQLPAPASAEKALSRLGQTVLGECAVLLTAFGRLPTRIP
jgi:hypothetical protein